MIVSAERVAELEAENARLREKVADLEYVDGQQWQAPLCLRLPRREEAVLGALVAHVAAIHIERLYRCVYGDETADKAADVTTLHSHISKLRTKLKPYGVKIHRRRNSGYWIEHDARQRILDLFSADEIEVPKWVPDDLRTDYDRHARRFGEFYAARVIRRQIHPVSREHARA